MEGVEGVCAIVAEDMEGGTGVVFDPIVTSLDIR